MLIVKLLNRRNVMAVGGALLLAGLVSCSDDDTDNTTSAEVAEAEAVDAIEASVATESNGMAKMVADASAVAMEEQVYTEDADLECGQVYTTGYAEAASSGGFSYDYSGNASYHLVCDTGIFYYSFDAAGTYETPRMLSDDSATANLEITGLATSQTQAVFNGSYVKDGYQESKVRQLRTFDSVLTYSLENVTVDKCNRGNHRGHGIGKLYRNRLRWQHLYLHRQHHF